MAHLRHKAPSAWGDPEAAFGQRRFWEAFQACLDRLPASGGRVFFKREIAGEDTETICKEEGITASNCWVILHRSRLQPRSCIERAADRYRSGDEWNHRA